MREDQRVRRAPLPKERRIGYREVKLGCGERGKSSIHIPTSGIPIKNLGFDACQKYSPDLANRNEDFSLERESDQSLSRRMWELHKLV